MVHIMASQEVFTGQLVDAKHCHGPRSAGANRAEKAWSPALLKFLCRHITWGFVKNANSVSVDLR